MPQNMNPSSFTPKNDDNVISNETGNTGYSISAAAYGWFCSYFNTNNKHIRPRTTWHHRRAATTTYFQGMYVNKTLLHKYSILPLTTVSFHSIFFPGGISLKAAWGRNLWSFICAIRNKLGNKKDRGTPVPGICDPLPEERGVAFPRWQEKEKT